MSNDLLSVLAEFKDARERDGSVHLTAWIERYPEFASELTEMAAVELALDGDYDAVAPAEEERFLAIAAEVRERMRSVSIPSLAERAKQRGISLPFLAKSLDLSIAELMKLNQRLFLASTLPRLLLERLANQLGSNISEMTAYLHKPPTLAVSVEYRSEQPPTLADQENFMEAIRSSRSMTSEQKSYWLETARSSSDEEE